MKWKHYENRGLALVDMPPGDQYPTEHAFAWIWDTDRRGDRSDAAEYRRYSFEDSYAEDKWKPVDPAVIKSMTLDELKRYLEVLVRTEA
jgi:hypothetical protein